MAKKLLDSFKSNAKLFVETNPLAVLYSQKRRDQLLGVAKGLAQDTNPAYRAIGRASEGAISTGQSAVNNLLSGGKQFAQSSYRAVRDPVLDIMSGGQTNRSTQSAQNLLSAGQGAVKTLKGASQIVTTPISAALGGVAGAIPDQRVNRLLTGVQRGITDQQNVGAEVAPQNVKVGPLEFDPLLTAGSFVGFTRNPMWRSLFPATSKLQTLFNPSTKSGKVTNFVFGRLSKGGIEGLVQGWSDMPENATPEEKVKHLLKNAGFGALAEISVDTALKGVGSINDKYTKQALTEMGDKVDEFVRRMRTPVKTTEIDPVTGLNKVVPMWQEWAKNNFQPKNRPGFANFDEMTKLLGDTPPTKGGEIISMGQTLDQIENRIKSVKADASLSGLKPSPATHAGFITTDGKFAAVNTGHNKTLGDLGEGEIGLNKYLNAGGIRTRVSMDSGDINIEIHKAPNLEQMKTLENLPSDRRYFFDLKDITTDGMAGAAQTKDQFLNAVKKTFSQGGVPEGGVIPRAGVDTPQSPLPTRELATTDPILTQTLDARAPSSTGGEPPPGSPPPKIPSGEYPPLLPGKTPASDPSSFVNKIKSKLDKVYTSAIDRFHPLSELAKKGGEDKAMREALTGHYGAGSTSTYHVDFELTPILKEQKLDDLREAAVAMRDIELSGRNIQGSNVAPLEGVSAGGQSDQAAQAVARLKKLGDRVGEEKMKSIGQTLQKLYAYQDKMVQEYLVKTGVLSEEAYRGMREKNQFYVPFKRVMDEVDEFLGVTPQSKQAGSVSGQNVIKGIKGSERQIIDPIESILESTYKMVGLGKRQEVARTIVSLKDKLPEGMITKAEGRVPDKTSISLFENGKVQKYSVPAEVADAARGMSEEQLNTAVKILSVPTKLFRATATGMNPEFAVPNIARDLQSAFVNAGLNPLKWIKGVSHLIKKDEVYQEFLKSGGKTSTISIDRPFLKKTVEQIDKGYKIKKPSDLLTILQNIGEYSEQPTRIAVFEDAIRKGKSPIEAANLAQEATVNFARRGKDTKSINAIYAFMNARAQGVDRMIRTLKKDPAGGALRVGMVTVAPAVANYLWNRNFESYDDPRILSETDKRTNFIIMLSDTPIPQLGGARYIKIPKGEIGKLANPVEEFLKYADNKGGEVKKALMDSLASFSPMDNIGDLIPTALRPPVEVASNYNFFYKDNIVPEYKQNYPPEYQDQANTGPIYRMVGQQLGVSPAKVQAIVEGYGTGIAKIGEMVTRPFVPDKYVTPRNEQGAPINRTPLFRRILGGEKRSEAEEGKMNTSRAKSVEFDIRDIQSGVRRGDIPASDGANKIAELEKKQEDILGAFGVDRAEVLKMKGVENGKRAEAVVRELRSLKSSEEKKAKLKEYVSKGVVTEEVLLQISKLLR